MARRTTIALIAMLIGGAIYVLWRNDSLLMFRWFAAVGLGAHVAALRAGALPASRVFPSWVYESLPQALWYYSGLVGLRAIWGDGHRRALLAWTAVLTAGAFGIELGQRAGVVPGTFDVNDLLLLIVAFVCATPSLFRIPITPRRNPA